MVIDHRDHVYNCFKAQSILAKTKGDIELCQSVYGFWFKDVAAGTIAAPTEETFVYKMQQVLIEKKTDTGEEIHRGHYVYGDPTDDYLVSETKGIGYVYLGIALEDAAASDESLLIEFDGTMTDVR
jgi:hypothetical protein